MKSSRIIAAMLAIVTSAAVYAQPNRQNYMLEQDWAGFDKYAEANAAVKQSPLVVFMGDSITEYWVDQDPDFFTDNNYIGFIEHRNFSFRFNNETIFFTHRKLPPFITSFNGSDYTGKNNVLSMKIPS